MLRPEKELTCTYDTHHMLFEVNNPMSLEEKATTATGDDSDDFDLSNL